VLGEKLRGARDLAVAPFTDSRGFTAAEPPTKVAEQLGVATVVVGKLSLQGERYQLALNAVAGTNGQVGWQGSFAGPVSELLSSVDTAASELAASLGVQTRLTPAKGPAARAAALENYVRGRAFLEAWDVERNYERAAEAFRAAIGLDDAFAEAHAMLALALVTQYIETKQADLIPQATTSAARALELSPELPEAHAAQGTVEAVRGHSAEAARAFERGLELAPADDFMCLRAARAYLAMGRKEEAERYHQRAIDLRPRYWYPYNEKGVFYSQIGRINEAKPLFRKVIELHPQGDIGYTNLAVMHILSGEYPEAVPLLETALRNNARYQTRNNLGVVYYAVGRFEDAAREWKTASETGGRDAIVMANLGDAYRQLGRASEAATAYAEARQAAEALLAVNPANSEARAFLAQALAGLGKCPDARRQLATALGKAPAPTLSYYAAVTSAVCGDRAEAVRHMLSAIEGGVVVDVRTNPDLKPMLGDPRVQRLLNGTTHPAAGGN
jgi:tetratricopeptide (TPR) repeat protein